MFAAFWKLKPMQGGGNGGYVLEISGESGGNVFDFGSLPPLPPFPSIGEFVADHHRRYA